MANLSKEQFDAMKSELLVIYDQLKDLKRDASRKSRDFDFDQSYVQRNEQTIDSLESRKKDLSASVEQKAKERVTLSEDSLDYFNNKIADLTKQLEDKKFEFDGYNLTYSQNAFVSSVNQFSDEIKSEFGSVKEKFDMDYKNSPMTDKYEDKDAKFEKQVNKMYEKFYDESNSIKASKEQYSSELEQLVTSINEAEDKHKDEIDNYFSQRDAAKEAGNDELVKKLSVAIEETQISHKEFISVENRKKEKLQMEISYLTSEEAELENEYTHLAYEVSEGITQGRKFDGEVATAEKIYALGVTHFDSGADLKDADNEVRAFKTDLEAFDKAAAEEAAMFDDTFSKVLSDLGIKQAKIVKVDEDLKVLPDAIAEANNTIDEAADYKNQLITDIENLEIKIKAQEIIVKTNEVELAGLPVDADPELIAKYEAVIDEAKLTISKISSDIEGAKGKLNQVELDIKNAQDLKAKSESDLAEVQAIEAGLKAEYDSLKAEFNDSNIKRAEAIAAKEEQRKAKIDAIVAAEEAQSVADKFKAKFNLNSMSEK